MEIEEQEDEANTQEAQSGLRSLGSPNCPPEGTIHSPISQPV